VVEGVRDALLEREELVGDEIEMLMAELGEREPMDVPAELVAGNGGVKVPASPGDGQGGNGQGSGTPTPPPAQT
jgi:hypothetical protein